MNILIALLSVSLVTMIGLLGSKISLVQTRRRDHNETVGIGHVIAPAKRRALHVAKRGAHKGKEYLLPMARTLVFRGGTMLHRLLITLGNRFFVFAAKIRGRGVLEFPEARIGR